MPILLIGLALIGGSLYLFSSEAMASGGDGMSKRLYGLPDIDPSQQGGTLKTDYDVFFESVADETGVPFALLKAHAYRESSLNPRAFTDENPKKRTDRLGWASRGLMQVLFWPGSTRLEKYGFSSDDLKGGDSLFDPYTCIKLGAFIIKDNLKACSGNLRDAVNMYNTGKKESQYQAPHDYVNRVISTYESIIKRSVS